MRHTLILPAIMCFALTLGSATRPTVAAESPVQFDLPSVAVAYPVLDVSGSTFPSTPIPGGWKVVTFELRLSCINASSSKSPMQQFVVRIKPRNPSLQVIDYLPRTEVVSDLTTPIQIKRTNEKSSSVGLSLDGSYGRLAHGNIGTDQGSKNTECVQFDRAAPLQAVIASGTFDRGRGVYFKLRWTDTQVLEGERLFRLTISVPPTWRGELIDVGVIGEAEHRSFASWETELKPVASAEFVVATFPHGDAEAASFAHRLANVEYELRSRVARAPKYASTKTLTGMLRQVAMIEPLASDQTWMTTILTSQSDSNVHQVLHQLPDDLRRVATEYVGVRRNFLALRLPVENESIARASANE